MFPPEQSASLVEVLDEIRAAEVERAAEDGFLISEEYEDRGSLGMGYFKDLL